MKIKGKKQIKAIQDQGYVKTIKKYDYDDYMIIISKKYLMN